MIFPIHLTGQSKDIWLIHLSFKVKKCFFHPEASSQATNNSQDEILDNSENTLLDISQSYLPMLDDADLGLQQSAAAEKEENISPYSMPYAENSDSVTPAQRETIPVEKPTAADTRVNAETEEEDIENVLVENIEYTKKGTIRKRKKYDVPLIERKKAKHHVLMEKHGVKSGCDEKCLKKCSTNISQERRIFLNREYWKMVDEKDRRAFILHHVSRMTVKQRTVVPHLVTADETCYQRNNSFKYMLKDEKGTLVTVCQLFFLTTLGYNKNNDKVIRSSLKNAENSVVPKQDTRCTRTPYNKIDNELIRQHINTFNPMISHYRREHAPCRLYLPTDLTFVAMHQDFMEKNPDFRISYEKYRVVAKDMNISLAKLGHEECETCEEFNVHDKNHTKEKLDDNCETCAAWKKHKDRSNKSRARYRDDAEKSEQLGEIIYCADLEKVIMLPRLDMFKSAIFTNRLTVYNESFVPVGKRKNNKPFAALWHDALFKRNKEELISTFYQFFLHKRDAVKITLWLDNCTAQNKNWAFFSFLIYIVNSEEVRANEVTVKYFEPGHTFMAADSFHHKVELSMKKMGNRLYDFADFIQAVKSAANKTEVFPMELKHFYVWQDYSSQYKLSRVNPRPYIHDMVQVSVTRGSYCIKYMNDFEGQTFELNFLNAKITKNNKLPPPIKQKKPIGIPSQKKANIIQNLGGIMKNRLQFWQDLPVCEEN